MGLECAEGEEGEVRRKGILQGLRKALAQYQVGHGTVTITINSCLMTNKKERTAQTKPT